MKKSWCAILWNCCRTEKCISDGTFNAVKNKWGTRGVVDLTALIGHYLLVAQILAAFDVELAPGMTAELPD